MVGLFLNPALSPLMSTQPPGSPSFFVPARLRELRAKSCLTLEALAKTVGVSHTQIANFEKGRRQPTLDTVRALARGLGVRPEDLGEESRVNELVRLHDLSTHILEQEGAQLDAMVREALDNEVRGEAWTDSLLASAAIIEGFGIHGVRQTWQVEVIAKAIRDTFGFGQQAVHDLVVGLEGKGTLVFELSEPRSFDAALYLARLPGPRAVLAVQRGQTGIARRIAVAEALGRSVLHPIGLFSLAQWRKSRRRSRDHPIPLEMLTEPQRVLFQEAVQRFGRAFLAPRTLVRHLVGKFDADISLKVTPLDAQLLAFHFGISVDSALLRLYDLELLNTEQLRQMRRSRIPEPPIICLERPRNALLPMLNERMNDKK